METDTIDNFTFALMNIPKHIDSLIRKGISLNYEDLSCLIKPDRPLKDLVEVQDSKVISASLYPLFTDLVNSTEFAFEILGFKRSPNFFKPNFGQTLADYLNNKFGLKINTQLSSLDFNPEMLNRFFDMYLKRGSGNLQLNVLHRFYKRDQTAFDALSKEFDENTIDLFGGTYTYMHFMRILEGIERTRLVFHNYRKFMLQAKQSRDQDPDFDIYPNLAPSLEKTIAQIPSILETHLIKKEGTARYGLDELIESYRIAKQRKHKESSNPHVIEEYERVMYKLVDWCFDDFFNNEYVSLKDFAKRYSMKDDDELFNRLQRILSVGEIKIYDEGPLSVAIGVLKNEGIDLLNVGNRDNERLDLIYNFNNAYLSCLTYITPDCKTERVEDFMYCFKKGEISSFESILLTESESARRLFGLTNVPSVVGDEKGSLALFVADRSKKYSPSGRLRILDPFSLQGDPRGYYVNSDIISAPKEGDVTIKSQIDLVSGLYSQIRAELVLREIVANVDQQDKPRLYSLEEAVESLGCREYFFRNIVLEHSIDHENPVIQRAYTILAESGEGDTFDSYDSFVDFYDSQLSKYVELRECVESARGYNPLRVDALKSLFISAEEVGKIMGFDFRVDDELIKRVRGERKKPYLFVRSTNGEAKYYKPEVEKLKEQLREDGTLRDIFIYHSIEIEFSTRRDK
jgi:hypothetical protein